MESPLFFAGAGLAAGLELPADELLEEDESADELLLEEELSPDDVEEAAAGAAAPSLPSLLPGAVLDDELERLSLR